MWSWYWAGEKGAAYLDKVALRALVARHHQPVHVGEQARLLSGRVRRVELGKAHLPLPILDRQRAKHRRWRLLATTMKLAELRLSSTLHGWDPLRIVAQICAIQCIHYILLAAFVPPLLSIFTASAALRFEGGPAQVGMLIDWRELASQPTWDWAKTSTNTTTPAAFTPQESAAVANWTAGTLWLSDQGTVRTLPPAAYVWNESDAGPAQNSVLTVPATSAVSLQELQLEQWEWQHTHDSRRGWAITAAWALTVFFDVQVLYYLVRKPTHVLDFVCTMHLLHLIVTSYVAGALPVSLYWWTVMFVHASLCILFAEHMAIQREMRVGFREPTLEPGDAESIEMAPTT